VRMRNFVNIGRRFRREASSEGEDLQKPFPTVVQYTSEPVRKH
jgi:hypothetical protein